MKYCLDCDWHTAAADSDQRDRSRAAIDHYVETGHTIDSSESLVRPTTPDGLGTVLARDLTPSSD
ncbi:hypothetical protein C488_07052 [Natrinema pellirubrum DSM 15624]|uniref:Uncharacterized protein n=1 Tax=Natrinema pellirubrum (strain DSM 15624 / CIP 106293 / JCM 10476 / NCIMB 786 / 157) TaxID=797303 RepID=L0JGR7_NATP1|nr:hypothetical protein [Natrinema pellirubrum]AGB30499.1 hypothetical protein Natpe_0572 [Natrinema pellirubrum DSM 15624]ELY77267.1 hypothetical protein C488_07052 [Natrinema pellirubrum DSM 15624]